MGHKDAERYLLEFQASAEPLPACQHILEHSASDAARFQAALALKRAALREWPLLAPEHRAALRAYLLHHVFKCAGCSLSGSSRSRALSVQVLSVKGAAS